MSCHGMSHAVRCPIAFSRNIRQFAKRSENRGNTVGGGTERGRAARLVAFGSLVCPVRGVFGLSAVLMHGVWDMSPSPSQKMKDANVQLAKDPGLAGTFFDWSRITSPHTTVVVCLNCTSSADRSHVRLLERLSNPSTGATTVNILVLPLPSSSVGVPFDRITSVYLKVAQVGGGSRRKHPHGWHRSCPSFPPFFPPFFIVSFFFKKKRSIFISKGLPLWLRIEGPASF